MRRPRTVSYASVFWVASGERGLPVGEPLALHPTRSDSSYEGVGLSVSRHPEEWARIARLGGEVYQLARIDEAPGRFAVFTPALERAAMTWGVEAGWAVRSEQWLLASWDGELDEPRELVFDTEDEARGEWTYMAESEDPEFESALAALSPGQSPLRSVASVASTPRLRKRLARWFKGLRGEPSHSDVEVEVTNLFVAEHWPELDGLWWQERLDPAALSAPRGVILPHALGWWWASKGA